MVMPVEVMEMPDHLPHPLFPGPVFLELPMGFRSLWTRQKKVAQRSDGGSLADPPPHRWPTPSGSALLTSLRVGGTRDPLNPIGAPGFEPGTSCSQSRRATELRHAPKCFYCNALPFAPDPLKYSRRAHIGHKTFPWSQSRMGRVADWCMGRR